MVQTAKHPTSVSALSQGNTKSHFTQTYQSLIAASTKPTHTHVPLSPYSSTHSTFHRPLTASASLCPGRNPLTPVYTLPAYAIHTPPPPAFVHSSLDVGDISGGRTRRQRMMRSRDTINVHDIEGAQTTRHRAGKRPITPPQPQHEADEATTSLQHRPTVVEIDTTDDAAITVVSPFSPALVSPPSRPHSSPPVTTSAAADTAASYRSPYTRFSHSPHVLTPPTIPFSALYHTAIPSTDPLPAFRHTLQRPLALPSKFAPLGGVDAAELDNEAGKGKQRRKWKRSKRLLGVSARVQCWHAGGGEIERSATHTGSSAGCGSEWLKLRAEDIDMVAQLTM